MNRIRIRPAGPDDIDALDHALRQLSNDLGDVHRATAVDLAAAAFASDPSFRALIAETGNDTVGAAVFSPVFSTRRGTAGVYVSDLWVSAAMRGSGLGCSLLAAAIAEGRTVWGAGFIKLAVYHSNPAALAFYEKLGFAESTDERSMILSGEALDALEGARQ